MKRRSFIQLLLATLVAPLKLMADTVISGKVTFSGLVTLGSPAGESFVGNSDPGLLITAITEGTIHHDWSPYFVGNGAGGFGWFAPESPKSVRALCRYKNAGANQTHLVYIIDDIDPCGNVQCQTTVDMSVGNTGDWICCNLETPWTPSPFTSYNTLSMEDNAGDGWMWEDTAVTSYRTQFLYTGITWTTYAHNNFPPCTTVAGSAGVDHEWTGVNQIFIP